MNGYGGGMPPYQNTAGPSPLTTTPYVAPPVYSDTSPTPYSTDMPVLAPDYPSTPLPTLPDTPTQLPLTGQPGQPVILPDTPTQFPLTGQPGLPTLPTEDGWSEPFPLTEPAGPLEWILDAGGDIVEFAGDVIKTGADILWDTGKFILEHLDVGIQYAGDIGGQKTSKRYYESLAESAELKAKAYARAVEQGLMSQEEAIARGIADGMGMQLAPDGSPVIFGQTAAGGPNYLLYAGIGLAAYYFLK